jgi:hypothetical protein
VQILIFKLELDPSILRIPRNGDRINDVTGPFFSQESNRETCNNESLADDNNTITVVDRASLTSVKNIINNFAVVSGLYCNFDKTCVMTTFVPEPGDINLIQEIGFEYADRIKLLGIEIVRSLDNVDSIFTGIRTKIVNLASFWERFRLTLPGRITVAKTFMVAQLNYAGSFLKPSDDIILQIQDIISNFVKGNLNIAREKICLPTSAGGLGMFNLLDFLAAQRCAWICRAHRLQIDNWRYDLKFCSPNHNIAQVRPCDLDPNLYPILYNLVCDFRNFYGKFSKVNGNYKANSCN